MKRTFVIFIVVILLLAALPCFGDYSYKASWEEQVHGMGYLILHLSSINAINGMNLTIDQARHLRQMALELEAISKKIPSFETIYRPDLAEVRDTYLEVRKYIISHKFFFLSVLYAERSTLKHFVHHSVTTEGRILSRMGNNRKNFKEPLELPIRIL